MEVQIEHIQGRRYKSPDGSERYLVDEAVLGPLTGRLGAELADPVKTTVVQNQRSITMCVLRKRLLLESRPPASSPGSVRSQTVVVGDPRGSLARCGVLPLRTSREFQYRASDRWEDCDRHWGAIHEGSDCRSSWRCIATAVIGLDWKLAGRHDRSSVSTMTHRSTMARIGVLYGRFCLWEMR